MRATRSPTHRGIAALAIYWLAVGASFFLLLQLCERECHGDVGIETGLDVAKLAQTSAWMSQQLGRELPGRVARALTAPG